MDISELARAAELTECQRQLAEARAALRDIEQIVDDSLLATNARELWELWAHPSKAKVLETHAATLKAAWAGDK
jgi:hypothetical protein